MLGGTTILLSLLIGVPLGILAALRQNSWVDYFITFVASLAVPLQGTAPGL